MRQSRKMVSSRQELFHDSFRGWGRKPDEKTIRQFDDVIRLKYPWPNVVILRISKSRTNAMRILIATDAWHPQVNGVVRTLTSLARSAAALEADIYIPDARRAFRRSAVPTYPGLRIALPNRREIAKVFEERRPRRSISPPKGRSAGRCAAYCRRRGWRSPPPTPRAFRNISKCAPGSRPASAMRCSGAFTPRPP